MEFTFHPTLIISDDQLLRFTSVTFSQARGHLEPSELLKGDVDETLPMVKKSLKVLYAFTEAYYEHCVKLPNYFPEGREPLEWTFPPSMIFHRYNKFVDLLETVEASCSSVSISRLNLTETVNVEDDDSRRGTEGTFVYRHNDCQHGSNKRYVAEL